MLSGRAIVVAISSPPGDMCAVRREQPDREDKERKRRGVEDVSHAAVPLPLDELLAQHTRGHHQELQEEPVVAKPQKQVGTQDNGKRAEAQYPFVAPRQMD